MPTVCIRAMSLHSPPRAFALLALTGLALSGCLGSGSNNLVKESFDSDNTYSRSYLQPLAQVCEAARRTLLSQGYTVANATVDSVQGTKNFQPEAEVHEQIILRVSCTSHEPDGSWVFVSAVQDRYALKKNPTSASVGVGVLGSVSLPIGATEDSLVRVASVTVQDEAFYGAFFDRLGQYLPRPKTEPKAEAKVMADTASPIPADASTLPPPTSAPFPDVTGGRSH
jgi:hypothetical protein